MMMRPSREPRGLFDVRYSAFLETVTHLRRPLHRYCARMTGSTLDGEDVMQEALFEAYRKIHQLEDVSALRPWLFRIAHNRCIDFIRSNRARARAEASAAPEDLWLPADAHGHGAAHAIERLVMHLPPMERASVLLKDIFDYSLAEVANLVGSTTGGVKAALHRGRAKLAALQEAPPEARAPVPIDPEVEALLQRYIRLFNSQDWDGIRALTSADARLQVADCYDGYLEDAPYFSEYQNATVPWQVALGSFEGEIALIVSHRLSGQWVPIYPVRLDLKGGTITGISDYYACTWVFFERSTVRAAAARGASN